MFETYILSHHNLGTNWSKSFSQNANLCACNVVDIDEKDLVIFAASFLDLFPLDSLGGSVLFNGRFLGHFSEIFD